MTREDRGASSFDELAVGLSSGTLSRSKALKLMGAALVGGALASIPGVAWAKPKPAGAKCKHNHQCASGLCVENPRIGAMVCTAPIPICTPSCPGTCSCAFAPDGTTTCIGCPPLQVCEERLVLSCTACCTDPDPIVCPSREVCLGGLPGQVRCAPACTAPV
jgi:hypothetical protein